MSTSFADLLGQHLARTHNSVNRLAKISGIPQRTLANWLNGKIRKPQQWQAVVKAATALNLTPAETDALLQSTGHPCTAKLRQQTTSPTDCNLLAPYSIENQQSTISNFPSPFQAIASPATFVGRETELTAARRALLNDGRAAVCGLRGMGGVGKTALAAHLAAQLRGDFPDGVLWARLDTTDTLSILGMFAGAYGKDVSHYRDVDSRAAVVRSLLADKRALLVLDNAENSAQVRPLLPPSTGSCAVLITTRADLSATDGWPRLIIEPFDPVRQEALLLFEKYLGRACVRQQQAVLLEIAALLGHLPLALSIAAGQLAYQAGGHGVENLLAALHQSASRLDALARDDQGVRVSFDVSYATLPPKKQIFFASLGVLGGDDFSTEAAAFVNAIPLASCLVELQHLRSLSLVEESRDGRWRLHPLLKDYAAEKLSTDHHTSYVRTRQRALAFYIDLVETCPSENQACLSLEISNLWMALEMATAPGYEPWLIRAALVIGNFLRQRHSPARVETYLRRAEHTADTLGDRKNQAVLLSRLGYLQWWQGKDPHSYYIKALKLARQTQQPALACETLRLLGMQARVNGHYQDAKTYYQEALAIALQTEDTPSICTLNNSLGVLLSHMQEFNAAEKYLTDALQFSREFAQTIQQIAALQNLGSMHSLTGKYAIADACLVEAEQLARQVQRDDILLGIFGERSDIALRQGTQALEMAEINARKSLEIARRLNFFQGECDALLRLGEVARRRQSFDEALGNLRDALEISERQNMPIQQATVLFSLAQLVLEQGDVCASRTHAQTSLGIFSAMNHQQAFEVRAWLDQISNL